MTATGAPERVGPDYEPLGPWWTFDAPSVRIADPQHEYVSIWTAGDSGASVLLVPATADDHRAWEPVLAALTAHFIVHAVDPRPADGPGRPDVDGVSTALAAVGARLAVAAGDAAPAALAALARGAMDHLVLCHPPADVLAADAPFVTVVPRTTGPLGAGDALAAALLAGQASR